MIKLSASFKNTLKLIKIFGFLEIKWIYIIKISYPNHGTQ